MIQKRPRVLIMSHTELGAIVRTERAAAYFGDRPAAWAAMAARVDPRLDVAPAGNC